jgi:hypothetical protein
MNARLKVVVPAVYEFVSLLRPTGCCLQAKPIADTGRAHRSVVRQVWRRPYERSHDHAARAGLGSERLPGASYDGFSDSTLP